MKRMAPGFTIIELLVVMSVLAILATAAMPLVEMTARRNKERDLKQAVAEIRKAIDAYKLAADAGKLGAAATGGGVSGYPPSLSVLVQGVTDGGGGQAMYFLRRLPRDPFGDPKLAPEKSWGLRAYSSSAEDPKEGADVYDVYSTSEAVGMNGVPYRQW